MSYRLTYYCGEKASSANENQEKIEHERNEIDVIIQSIIPPHVITVLGESGVYSQNHDNVGVVFATIVNFNEFYEENYKDGTECIRLLNEVIGDVDDLLGREGYEDIEKIKTIGTTIMIASGLNPNIERDANDPNAHLRSLMKFCIDMQNVIDEINNNMFWFNFVLRVGFNHGAVTAGVIGTTKLLYDIWGDTVNTASRMDSTGEKGRIQISETSCKALENEFNFVYRGKTFVKGKGDMETYLLVRDDEDKRVIKPNPTPTVPFPGCTS